MMLFRIHIKKKDDLVEIPDEDISRILTFCKSPSSIKKKIFREGSIITIETTEELDEGEEINIKPENFLGGVFYLNLYDEKGSETYFKVLDVYRDTYSRNYVVKVLEALLKEDEVVSIELAYYKLENFLTDDRVIYFDNRFPKTIETGLTNFINIINNE